MKKKKGQKKDRFGNEISPRVIDLMKINDALPAQRTEGWFQARKNCLTASTLASILRITEYEIKLRDSGIIDMKRTKKVGQVFDTYNSFANLLRTKCGLEPPLEPNATMEWGVAYEPIVTALYEASIDEEVFEFGMIPHPKISFFGASPDGITSSGMMLEIKCPYRRQPTGVPKSQYWMQMQLQMECCDLDHCTFLDVVMLEHTTLEEYVEDVFEDPDAGTLDTHRTRTGLPKGFIMEMVCDPLGDSKDYKFTYGYPPLYEISTPEEIIQWCNNWAQEQIDAMSPEEKFRAFVTRQIRFKARYWFVKDWTQVLVERDREWFNLRLPDFEAFWNLVVECRKNGVPAQYLKSSSTPSLNTSQQQLTISATDMSLVKKDEDDDECMFYEEEEEPTAKKSKKTAKIIDKPSVECLFFDDSE